MCTTKDALRHEQLAQIFLREKNLFKARFHFLEACSIYTLNQDKEHNSLKKANECYAQICKIDNKPIEEKSRQQLAKITLHELDKNQKIEPLVEIRKIMED